MLRHILLLGLALAAPASARARHIPQLADSTAAQILNQLRRTDPRLDSWMWAGGILRQVGKPQARAKLDAVADGLADIAIAAKVGDGNERTYAEGVQAVGVIAGSGAPGLGAYDGALDRLIRIHRDAGPTPIRTVALRAMTNVGGRVRALAYLRQVAISADATAPFAVSALISDAQAGGPSNSAAARQETTELLRVIWVQKLMKNPEAVRMLMGFANTNGWGR